MVPNIFQVPKVDRSNQWLCIKSLNLPKNIYNLLDNNICLCDSTFFFFFFFIKTHGTLIKLSSTASCERYKLKEYQIKKYVLWTRTQKCCTWFIYNLNHVKSLIISMRFNMLQILLSTFPHVKRSVLSVTSQSNRNTHGVKKRYIPALQEKSCHC